MRRLALLFSAMVLSLALGCGGSSKNGNADCEDACHIIYATCQLSLTDTGGNVMSEGQCITACDGLNRASMAACAQAAQCDTGAVVACFQ